MNKLLCLVLPARIFLLPLVIIQGYEPEFASPLNNLTVAVGREAIFSCVVEHLGGYRVGWVKADTKAIQAIHEHVITHNPRVAVSHSDHTTWNLHIRNVQEEDRGTYMCQINTDPMKSEMGYLDVVVPPDIIDEESSGDVMVPEGGSVTLVCKARGYPTPDITWKREDRSEIVFRESSGKIQKVMVHEGSMLRLSRISRSDMGHYMCMASNGVPPAVSKRISINVHFPPVIQVPNQLVGAPLGTDVTLECYVEASPKAIIYWMRDSSDNMVVTNEKYETKIIVRSLFETKMMLRVYNLEKADVGTYRCVAKNSLGEVERSIRLYEIPGAVGRVYPALPAAGSSIPSQTGHHNHQIISGTGGGAGIRGSHSNSLEEDDLEVDGESEEEGSADSSLPDTPPPSGRQIGGHVTSLDTNQESRAATHSIGTIPYQYCILLIISILVLP